MKKDMNWEKHFSDKMNGHNRNAPCKCRSGLKTKKCCGLAQMIINELSRRSFEDWTAVTNFLEVNKGKLTLQKLKEFKEARVGSGNLPRVNP